MDFYLSMLNPEYVSCSSPTSMMHRVAPAYVKSVLDAQTGQAYKVVN